MSVRLDRIQQGLMLALAGVAPIVCWTYGHPARGEDDVLALRLTSGPSPGIRQGMQGEAFLPGESVIVRVSGATSPRRSVVELNGFRYQYDVGGADTVTTIRNGLLADINAGEIGAVTATTDGVDGLLLTADLLGGLRALRLFGELAAESLVLADDAVLVTAASVRALLTLTAYSSGRELRTGAWAIIDAALDELRSEDRVDVLDRYGVALAGRGAVNDLTAVAGGLWESRCAVDVTLAARTVFVRPTPYIDTVVAQFAVDFDGDGTADDTFDTVITAA